MIKTSNNYKCLILLKLPKDVCRPSPDDVRPSKIPGIIDIGSILFIHGAFECLPNAALPGPERVVSFRISISGRS